MEIKKPKFILPLGILLAVGILLALWLIPAKVIDERNEYGRCRQYEPPRVDHSDVKACIDAGCKILGGGEWQCVPQNHRYF